LYVAGDLVFTGGEDMVMRMYNVTNGTLLREFNGHTGKIIAITVFDDFVFSGGGANVSF
jgi:hypothetical protein